MKSSPRLVYNIFKNYYDKFIKNRKVEDVFKYSSFAYYKQPDFVKRHCQRIYNEIESHLYTYQDYILFTLYHYLYNDTQIHLESVTYINTREVKKLFTKQQLEKDRDYILKLNGSLKLNELEDYFSPRGGGTNILYELIKEKKISPLLYIRYYNKMINDKTSKEFHATVQKFNHVIIEIIKGASQ